MRTRQPGIERVVVAADDCKVGLRLIVVGKPDRFLLANMPARSEQPRNGLETFPC